MELAPAGIPLSFEVTFDVPGLPVAMSVYDDSGASPVLVSGPIAMANVVNATYRGKFTGLAGKNYIVFKAVYTDGTFATLSSNYAQGSESIVCQNMPGISGPGGCNVVGFVSNNCPVIGPVNC